MTDDDGLDIVCYSAWAGAEATYRFADQTVYEAARAFLDKLTGGAVGGALPSGYGGAKAYYFIDTVHRDAFSEFMRRSAQ